VGAGCSLTADLAALNSKHDCYTNERDKKRVEVSSNRLEYGD